MIGWLVVAVLVVAWLASRKPAAAAPSPGAPDDNYTRYTHSDALPAADRGANATDDLLLNEADALDE
jgi:hypothetical protein